MGGVGEENDRERVLPEPGSAAVEDLFPSRETTLGEINLQRGIRSC